MFRVSATGHRNPSSWGPLTEAACTPGTTVMSSNSTLPAVIPEAGNSVDRQGHQTDGASQPSNRTAEATAAGERPFPVVVDCTGGPHLTEAARASSGALDADPGADEASCTPVQNPDTTPVALRVVQHAPADPNLKDIAGAVFLKDIKVLIMSARKKGTVRGERVFRRNAGRVCRLAREACGLAGLLWTEAAWRGALEAAMSGLETLVDVPESALLEGFERAVASSAAAHLEGLKQQGTVCTRKNGVPRRASPHSRQGQRIREKQSKARSDHADSHSLHCHACGATAEVGLRGSKEEGRVKYSCRVHATSSGCFRVDKERAAWAEEREMRRLRAEERRLEEELRQLGGASADANLASTSNVFHRSAGYWASMPMSQSLIATLLLIGGVERNPGPAADEGNAALQGRTSSGCHAAQRSIVRSGRPPYLLPSLEALNPPRLVTSGDWRVSHEGGLDPLAGLSEIGVKGGQTRLLHLRLRGGADDDPMDQEIEMKVSIWRTSDVNARPTAEEDGTSKVIKVLPASAPEEAQRRRLLEQFGKEETIFLYDGTLRAGGAPIFTEVKWTEALEGSRVFERLEERRQIKVYSATSTGNSGPIAAGTSRTYDTFVAALGANSEGINKRRAKGGIFTPRIETVHKILSRLQETLVLLLAATPCSGKTSICQLVYEEARRSRVYESEDVIYVNCAEVGSGGKSFEDVFLEQARVPFNEASKSPASSPEKELQRSAGDASGSSSQAP